MPPALSGMVNNHEASTSYPWGEYSPSKGWERLGEGMRWRRDVEAIGRWARRARNDARTGVRLLETPVSIATRTLRGGTRVGRRSIHVAVALRGTCRRGQAASTASGTWCSDVFRREGTSSVAHRRSTSSFSLPFVRPRGQGAVPHPLPTLSWRRNSHRGCMSPPSHREETPIGDATPSPRDRWSLFLVWAEAAWKVDVEERTLRRGGEDDMSAAAASAIEVDLERAVVAQVGKLGHAYNRWVYRPQHRVTLRFFEKDWMENLTRTPWWVIPAIWMPLVAWTGRQSLLVDDTHPQGLTAFFAIGMVAWGAMEYFIHRCLFHATPTSHWGITMHFLLHGCHHKSPDDRLRLVFPPAPAAIVIFLVHSILTVSLPTALAKAWFAGMLFGYVCYDCCHYFIHHGGKMEGILLGIRKNHMKHHYKDPAHGFGISTPLFDIVFGTLSQK